MYPLSETPHPLPNTQRRSPRRHPREVEVSEESIRVAGILLITVPTIAFGGARLLLAIASREDGYLDNPVRQNLWRAGHAHAGVLVIFALVGLLLLDQADLSSGLESVVRWGLVIPPILMPLGFFLSVASPRAERPNDLIYLVPVGGTVLAITALALGIGLVTA
jgi:hypothetical protein